ncbi:Transmembrane protein 184C [Mytilus edulis]|uniref:Transmembrane protein 184C n=1 Tax=Mytilus edulis TaxID=6550 RepID=A0A8S3TLC7_MYTED|nr:Transmembrane protein 184C [Mytilus edulis]
MRNVITFISLLLQWFALRFPHAAIYLDTIRECYEAYVIYNFMAYLLQYLNNQHQLQHFEQKDPVTHICPLCCIRPWRINRNFIQRCKHGALQYTIVRPLTTVVALACEMGGKYHEGDFDFKWFFFVEPVRWEVNITRETLILNLPGLILSS